MNEKEFLGSASDDVLFEETNNLKNNFLKIEQTIKHNKSVLKKAEENMENYKGDYQNYAVFLHAKNETNECRDIIKKLEDTEESPYHMHLYLSEKEHDEDMFIGSEDVTDKDGNNVVYSIWGDVATHFSENKNTTLNYKGINYKLEFKRNISIENKKIVDLVEAYNSRTGRNEQVTDYFLRNILKEKKNEKGFTDIIKTIQDKQNDIIRADINKNIICQGVAGSGKTVIIVHRLSNLLYNNPKIPTEKYLFIAPNSNFKQELSDLNKKLKIDKIKLSTLYEYYIEKMNYYLQDNISSQLKYEIKYIIDDDDENIEEIYSSKYFEKKYNYLIEKIYNDINEITYYYKFVPNKKNSFRENMSQLRKIIDTNMSSFNEKKNLINKNFKDIIEMSKKLGQATGRLDDINDFFKIINSYEEKTKKIVNDYKSIISSTEKEMLKKREILYYDFYSKYNFSSDDIEEDINKLKDRKNNLEIQTSEKEKSLFGVFQSPTIENNKKIIKELKKDIQELESKYEYMQTEDFDSEWNKYNELEKNLNKYSNAIICLNESIELSNEAIKSSDAYKMLTITDDITYDQVISYNRVFKNLLTYIELNCEKTDIKKIVEIKELLIKTIAKNFDLNYSDFVKDKDYLNLLVDNIKASLLIKKCFTYTLENKYIFSYDELKKSNFLRNDIVLLLYIFNRLGFSKDKMYEYLYIDEAQDYNDFEIVLLRELEGNPTMNIFGDHQQNISNNSLTRPNWNSLMKCFDNKFWYCELNENYRNTTSIVDYCNDTLKTNMIKIGIEGNPLVINEKITINELIELYNSREFQIITNNLSLINIIKKIDYDIKVNTVSEVKGLEFENIIVIDTDLDINNKYVAYTRTKNDLIIIKDVILSNMEYIENDYVDDHENQETQIFKKNGLDDYSIIANIYEDLPNEVNDDNYTIDFDFDEKIQKLIENIDDYKENANELLVYYKKEEVSNELKERIINRLIINGLIINPKLNELSFEEILERIINLIKDVKYISDTEFVNTLCYYSDNSDMQDKLHEKIQSLGYVILEDE